MAVSFDGAFANVNNAIQNIGRQNELSYQRQAQQEIGADLVNGDYKTAAQKAFRFGDASTGLSLLKLGQGAEEAKREADFLRGLSGGIVGGGAPSQNGVSGAPAASPVALGNPGEIENQFVGGVRSAGLNNPVGLAAVAAYGRAESSYSPGNINRQWNDPSTSGAPGQSGGIMSWREDRLRNLYKFAQSRGEQPGSISPATQAAFFASEDPSLIPKLNAAKTPEEANQIMANAWRFAGFDKPGGENARRLAMTRTYAARFGAEPPANAVASAAPVESGGPVAPVAGGGGTYAQSTPEQLQAFLDNPRVPEPMKIMMRQELASRGIGQGQAPVQVAQAAPQPGAPVPDVPAAGAVEAQGFVVPGSGEVYQGPAGVSISQDKNVQRMLRFYESAPSERSRALVKPRLDLAIKEAEQRYSEGKTPEAAREWQWARERGLTNARTPIEYAKERAEATRTDSAPTVRQLKQADGSEVAVQWNPQTKTWDPLAAPQGGEAVRPTGTKLTEGQSKDLIYHNRGIQALETFEPLAAAYANGTERLMSQVPGGNYAVSEEFQKAQQSGRNFLASILRKDTGAAITAPEEKQYGEIFLPQPGDKPGTLAQKANARRQAIDAIRGGLGTAEVLALGERLIGRQPGEKAPAPSPAPTDKPAPTPTQFRDGQRARGPQGEIIVFRNGQWAPES